MAQQLGGTRAREKWGTRLGFICAAVGSAVGLGNIWRFPYITGENGGAALIVVYLLCILLCGLPIMIAELSIGRNCLLYTSPSPRDVEESRMPSSA